MKSSNQQPSTAAPEAAATPGDTEIHRDQIIEAVWQVIARHGMAAVSMRSVATAAGVSVGRIQYRFGSKDDLIRASLRAMLSGAEQLQAQVGDTAEVTQTLWQLVAHPIPRAAESPGGVSVFHQYLAAALNDPALAALLGQAKLGQEGEVLRLLDVLAPALPDSRTAARTLVATADGLAMRVLVGSLSTVEAEQTLRAEFDRFIG